MNKVKDLFREELVDELEDLSKIELGTDEHRAAAGTVSQLTDRVIKMEELELRAKEIEAEKAKTEVEAKKAEIEARKIEVTRKDNNLKNGIAIGTAVVGALITVGLSAASLWIDGKGVLISTDVGRKNFGRGFDYFFKK